MRKRKALTWIRDGDCIICTSHSCGSSGYPHTGIGHKTINWARLILFRKYGKQPSHVVTRHTCDNKKCINPDHIIPGSCQDNDKDRVNRNRQARGERVPQSKLNSDQVKMIKNLLSTTEPIVIQNIRSIRSNSIVYLVHQTRNQMETYMKVLNGSHPNKQLFDLALWFSGTMREEGERLSQHEIARNCSAAMKVLSGKDRGISAETIRRIEHIGLRKLRSALYRDKSLRDELELFLKTPVNNHIRNRQTQ